MRLGSILSLLAWALALACSGPGAFAAPPAPAPVSGQFRDCPECPAMVRVPGGTFRMGDDAPIARADEKPVHEVSIKAFAAGSFEITRKEFAAFVAATGHEPATGCMTDRAQGGRWRFDEAASWRDPGFPQTEKDPVVCIGWADASAYATWLSQRTGKAYRLLSEAEWEYAARAGSTSEFWWGDSADDLCAYADGPDLSAKAKFPAWRSTAACDDAYALGAPVGSFKPNAFGLHDMAGNAWEWTADCYVQDYGPQPRDGTAYVFDGCVRRVLRGGSWVYGLLDLRSAQRNGLLPATIQGGDIGFRVARSL